MSVLTTPGVREAIERGWPVHGLVHVDHPDGPVRVHSGIGRIRWSGHDWTGLGPLGAIRNIGGTRRLGIRVISLVLRGLDGDVEQWLNDDIRGRPAKAWLAGIRPNGKVNGAPDLFVDGACDYDDHELPVGGQSDIILHVATPVWLLERAQNEVYTEQWLQKRFGGLPSVGTTEIGGFKFLKEIEDKTLDWTQS